MPLAQVLRSDATKLCAQVAGPPRRMQTAAVFVSAILLLFGSLHSGNSKQFRRAKLILTRTFFFFHLDAAKAKCQTCTSEGGAFAACGEARATEEETQCKDGQCLTLQIREFSLFARVSLKQEDSANVPCRGRADLQGMLRRLGTHGARGHRRRHVRRAAF